MMGPQQQTEFLGEGTEAMLPPHMPGGGQAAMLLLQQQPHGWPRQDQSGQGRPALQLLPLKRPRQDGSSSDDINFGSWQQHVVRFTCSVILFCSADAAADSAAAAAGS
jgi:hypothetical protein